LQQRSPRAAAREVLLGVREVAEASPPGRIPDHVTPFKRASDRVVFAARTRCRCHNLQRLSHFDACFGALPAGGNLDSGHGLARPWHGWR
jgi:hypothetical protein